MPTAKEIRSKARADEAEALVRWAQSTGHGEGASVTIGDILTARLIVAVESLEDKLDGRGRGSS